MTRDDAGVVIEEMAGGTPWGLYDVLYYRLRQGVACREAHGDTDVSEAYVRREAARLRPHEALVATCRSQTGGLCAYGGDAMRRAMAAREGA